MCSFLACLFFIIFIIPVCIVKIKCWFIILSIFSSAVVFGTKFLITGIPSNTPLTPAVRLKRARNAVRSFSGTSFAIRVHTSLRNCSLEYFNGIPDFPYRWNLYLRSISMAFNGCHISFPFVSYSFISRPECLIILILMNTILKVI